MKLKQILESGQIEAFNVDDVLRAYSFSANPEVEVINNEVYAYAHVDIYDKGTEIRDGKRVIKYPFHTIGKSDGDRETLGILSDIDSFVGFPKTMYGSIRIYRSMISNFENISEKITGSLLFDDKNPKLTTLNGISKHLKECGQNIKLPSTITSAILGILQIKGLNPTGHNEKYEKVHVAFSPKSHSNVNLHRAVEILNSHLNGERDIVSCKRELVSAGLQEFAKL